MVEKKGVTSESRDKLNNTSPDKSNNNIRYRTIYGTGQDLGSGFSTIR